MNERNVNEVTVFIDFFLLVRLIIIPFVYIGAVVLMWPDWNFWVLLIGIVPLTINVWILSSPMWNFLILHVVAMATLYVTGTNLEPLLHERSFWGVLTLLFGYSLFVAVLRNKILPLSPLKIQAKIARLFRKKDNMIVVFDPNMTYILDISKLASRAYGWKRNRLINSPSNLIYHQNLVYDIPYDFWQQLQEKGKWHGFMEVKTQSGCIFEERAQYQAMFDSFSNIIRIEKKVFELIYKKHEILDVDAFQVITEESPSPSAIINRSHKIAKANPSLIKLSARKPSNHHSLCVDIFSTDSRLEVAHCINKAFDTGVRQSFEGNFDSVNGICHVYCSFIPFKPKKSLWVTHVLLVFHQVDNRFSFVPDENINKALPTILKDKLTELYKLYPNTPLRIYSQNLSHLYVQEELWNEILSHLFKIGLLALNPTHTLVFSLEPEAKCLSVLFAEAPYRAWDEWQKFSLVKDFIDFLENNDLQHEHYHNEEGTLIAIYSTEIAKFFE